MDLLQNIFQQNTPFLTNFLTPETRPNAQPHFSVKKANNAKSKKSSRPQKRELNGTKSRQTLKKQKIEKIIQQETKPDSNREEKKATKSQNSQKEIEVKSQPEIKVTSQEETKPADQVLAPDPTNSISEKGSNSKESNVPIVPSEKKGDAPNIEKKEAIGTEKRFFQAILESTHFFCIFLCFNDGF